jgi:hypothetical protein
LQIERARYAKEKRETEERLAVTQQKMTTAVQVSIEKVKFLQSKLNEAKLENGILSKELNQVKLENIRLTDELIQETNTGTK